MISQEIEAIVRELKLLARGNPLSQEELERVKELMSRLRDESFTNRHVSELTGDGWSEQSAREIRSIEDK